MRHPIRKHLTISLTYSLDEAAALENPPFSAQVAAARTTRRAIARRLRSLRWIERLEAEARDAGLSLA